MMTAAKWALGIVPAGIMLGALLGAAVNPDMKDAPTPWWRLTGTDAFTARAEPALDAWPQDFSAARSYRPDLDYDAEVWALPIPADEVWAMTDEPIAPPPHSMSTEAAATDAEAAAGDAFAAAAPDPEAAAEASPETPEPLPPQLAGLY